MAGLADASRGSANRAYKEAVMHECPECGQACCCDMEDHEQDAPDDCCHECDEDTDDEELWLDLALRAPVPKLPVGDDGSDTLDSGRDGGCDCGG